jgi:hypothetical protein
MCEILAVAWPEPRPLALLLERAVEVERWGVDGFGWGVAWLDEAHVGDGERDGDGASAARVVGYRSVESLSADRSGRTELADVRSRRQVIHLRRPSLLSTIDLADTQPFVAEDGGFAFAHNGRFEGHQRFRAQYDGRLRGRADSEVGLRMLEDRLAAGEGPADALTFVLSTLGGYGNLVYLGADGRLVALGDHYLNPFWRFHLDGGVVASTACHSEDDSVFRLAFADARDRARLTAHPRDVLSSATTMGRSDA